MDDNAAAAQGSNLLDDILGGVATTMGPSSGLSVGEGSILDMLDPNAPAATGA